MQSAGPSDSNFWHASHFRNGTSLKNCHTFSGFDGFLSHVCHTGDSETHTGWGERFEHPTKTWACATHKQFTMQMVAVAIAKATWNWVEGSVRRQ